MMHRLTPLARTRIRLTQKPLRRRSTRQQRLDREYRGIREHVYQRASRCCEVCGRLLERHQFEAHHRLPKSAGRDDSPANLMCLCIPCHAWITTHPEGSYPHGWLVHRGQHPADVPVTIAGRGLVHLTTQCTYQHPTEAA